MHANDTNLQQRPAARKPWTPPSLVRMRIAETHGAARAVDQKRAASSASATSSTVQASAGLTTR